MEGSKQDPGINYRAMKELFRSACMSVNKPLTCGIRLVVELLDNVRQGRQHRWENKMSPATLWRLTLFFYSLIRFGLCQPFFSCNWCLQPVPHPVLLFAADTCMDEKEVL